MKILPPWSNWKVLLQLREGAGITQAELARRSGVSRSQIANIESGRRPNFKLTDGMRLFGALMVLRFEKNDKFELVLIPGVDVTLEKGEKVPPKLTHKDVRQNIGYYINGVKAGLWWAIEDCEKQQYRLKRKIDRYKEFLAEADKEEEYFFKGGKK